MDTPVDAPRRSGQYWVLALAAAVAFWPMACNCGPILPGEEDGSTDGSTFDGDGGDGGDGNNGGGGDGGDGGPEEFDRDASCAAESSTATLRKRPVDIIFVIDNSGSMQSEIIAVQDNININFAGIIQDAGIDYRVIMLSDFGCANPHESICVSDPLSGNSCPPADCASPGRPVNTERFFHHSVEIGSTNSFQQIEASYNTQCTNADCPLDAPAGGWSEWLRDDARQVFIEITDDDNSNMTPAEFDTMLRSLTPAHFGDGGVRDYVFHTIGGLAENDPVTEPWLPTDPIVTGKCTGNGGDSVNNSQDHQEVSIMTGGLRFPICQYTSFDAVFQHVAQGVIAGTQVECDFPIPEIDGGQVLDTENILVEYLPSDGGTARIFDRVADQASCGTSEAFYLQTDFVSLCTAACDTARADPGAEINVLFQCKAACQGTDQSCSTSSPCCSGLVCLDATSNPCADGETGCTCQPDFG